MKRKWLMVPLVTGILAAGLVGATAFAHNNDGEQESPKDAVATKVAAILGIEDPQIVKDALVEATQEVRDEQVRHRLDDVVEAGVMTQAEADAYYDWYLARPDGPNLHRNSHRLFGGGDDGNSRPGHRFGGRGQGLQRFGGQGFPGQEQLPPGLNGEVPAGTGTSF